MPGPDLSRRHLVVGGSAGALGAFGLTAVASAPIAGAAVGQAQTTAPAYSAAAAGSTRSVALGSARTSAASSGTRLLSLGETAARSRAALTIVSVAVTGGAMVGVVFPDGTDAESVAVRVTRNGTVGDWVDLPLNDSEPDPDSRDASGHVTGSDPMWVGDLGADATVEVQLRPADLATARLEIVDPGQASAPASRGSVAAALFSADTSEESDSEDGTVSPSAGDDAAAPSEIGRPRIRSRAEWGADESLRKGSPSYSDTIKACVVHHTADGGDYTQSQVPSVIRGMYRYHTVSLGWSDLGYNFVVDRFGGIWEGRAGGITRAVLGAHAGGFNVDTFGVSMMGDFTAVAPPAAMLESVAQVIAWKLSLYGLPAIGSTSLTSAGGGTARYKAGTTVTLRRINAHRDVGFTACPGNVGFTKMDQIRSRTAEILKSAGATTTATSPVSAKYVSIGAAAAIGAATGAEGAARSGGRYRHYAIGSIYYSTSTGAHVVKGLIRDRYKAVGWENSPLGFPTTDEIGLPGGAFNHFQGGSIYFSPRSGAHVVRGLIRDKWASLGWEGSFLGYPTTDEIALRGGSFNHFTGGSIYFSPRNGAHVVRGAIRDKWAASGWEAGVLGYPTTDEIALPGGAFNHFTGGSVYFSPRNGAHLVLGAIRDAWAAKGWEGGPLGYPTSDEYAVAGGRRSDFTGGSITYDYKSGKTTVRGN